MSSDLLRVVHASGRIELSGELDLQSSRDFLRAVADLDGAVLDLDLSGLTFIDSSGVKALLKVHREHAGIRMVAATTNVRHVLRVAGLSHLIVGDEATAD